MCVAALQHGFSSLSILGRYSFTQPFACCSLTRSFFTYFSKSMLLACCSLAWTPTCFATPHPYSLHPACCSTFLLPACCSTFLLPACCSFFFFKGTFGARLRLYSPRLLPACLLLFLAYVSPDGTPSPSFSFASSLSSYNQQGEFFLQFFSTFYLIILKRLFFKFSMFCTMWHNLFLIWFCRKEKEDSKLSQTCKFLKYI